MPTATEETAEAICGALHRTDFEFTGEQTLPRNRLATYWRRGHAPQAVAVEVQRDDPFVRCYVTWHNIADPPRIVRAQIELKVDCSPDRARAKLEESTRGVVEKVLEVYRDVLSGTGYASKDYLHKTHARWRPTI
jgi:hypothetical protein